ncbi:MAG TPA: asparaginase [Anaerolineae bacterium]|nr:asparaginase [Anaerolineae bacterium]
MAEHERVVVIFTGGTIAMLPDPLTGAAMPALDGAGIVARVPGLAAIAELETIDWGIVPASHLRFGQILELAELIGHAVDRPGVQGVVVVQGTDVLEETAFAWDLLHAREKPVVVVGAMRNAAEPGFDGPRNLADAVRVASDPRFVGEGVLVVMGGSILPADDVTKSHSQALDSFAAPNHGRLGRVDGGDVVLERRRPPRRRLQPAPQAAAEPVALLTAVVSTDGDLLRAAVGQGAKGVVVAATGAGNTDPDLLAAAVDAMAEGVPVVLTTRCASGAVGPHYGFPGGGRSWQDAGAILAGTLSGPKARIALALGLGAGLDGDGLSRLFAVRSDA